MTGHEGGGAPAGMTPEERDDRVELGTYLRRSIFPADREALLAEARANHAPDHFIAELERLPSGQSYENPVEAWAAATGGPTRDKRF
jgi:hypothetical protein